MSLDLPAFIDDDVVLAGIVAPGSDDDEDANDADDAIQDDQAPAWAEIDESEAETASGEFIEVDHDDDHDDVDDGTYLRAVDDDIDEAQDIEPASTGEHSADNDELADVISIDTESDFGEDGDVDDDAGSGTFLAEVIAAAEDDVALAPENDDSDRFLSELRGLTDEGDEALDSDAADTFFDDDK